MKLNHKVFVALMAVFLLLAAACNQDQTPPELTGTVNISGTMKVGEEVTANITGSNGTDGKFTYQWTRTPEGGTALEITGANGQRFVITEDEVDHTLGVIMGNADTIGTRTGTAAEKVVSAEVAQFKTLLNIPTSNGTVNVTINYTALPNTTPGYMLTLETVVRIVLSGIVTNGDLIINVIAGDSEFALAGSKTLSVGETWISNATEMEMGISISDVLIPWVTMIQPNTHNTIRMASVGASRQHQKPLTNPKKIRVRERRLEREYLAMVNVQNDITRNIIQGRNGITI